MKRKADGEPTERLQLPAGTSTASASASGTGTATSSAVWQASDDHYYCRGHDGRDYWVPPPHVSSAWHPYHPTSHAWDASAAWNVAYPPSTTNLPVYMYDASNINKFKGWEKRFSAALLAIGDTDLVLLPRAMAMAQQETHDMNSLRGPLLDDIIRRCKRDAELAGMTFTPPPPPPATDGDDAVAKEAPMASAASSPGSASTGDLLHGRPIGNNDAVEPGAASEADADAGPDRHPDKITWEQGGSGVPTETVLRERYSPSVYIAPPRSFQESYEQKQYRIRLMIDAQYYYAGGGGQSTDKKRETSSEVRETVGTSTATNTTEADAKAEAESEANHNVGSSNNISDVEQDTCTLSAQCDQDDDCNLAVFGGDDDDDGGGGGGDGDDDDDDDDDKGTSMEDEKKEEEDSGDANASMIRQDECVPGTDSDSEDRGAMGQQTVKRELASASPSQYKAPPITYNLGLSWPDHFYCDPPWWSNKKDKDD